ncbi:hypothetical protein [Arthrobacter sp. NyZ413]|uniref:hypothetical protein n=1 Tax=Arthrobacter sp. NyZ413 TaxID=3144669 RepID=UPI002C7C9D4B|nr:hypothetical protein [Arthrobacter sp.]
MSIRNRGKRLASGITAVAGAGSLAGAGIVAAVLYAGTPGSASRVDNSSTNSNTSDGSVGGDSGSTSGDGSNPYNGFSRSRNFGGTNPVQPGYGGVTHGNSSGS